MSNIGITNTTFFKILFIYFFFKRERKGRKKRERETLMCERYIDRLPITHPHLGTWAETQARALTGSQTSDLLVCRLELNPLSHTSQGTNITFNMKSQNSLPKNCNVTKPCRYYKTNFKITPLTNTKSLRKKCLINLPLAFPSTM